MQNKLLNLFRIFCYMEEKMQTIMKNIKLKLIKNKYNIFIYLGMLFFSLVICTNFIRTHFALDTYCVYAYDSTKLITNFLLSNRLISALAIWISNMLKIPFFINMKILTILGIIFLTISWFILYKFIIKINNKQTDILYNLLIAGISYIIIFNFCTVEYLVFWESAVMCLGILFTTISSCIFNTDIKYKNFIVLFILFLGSICYQGAITLFIPLSLVLILYKQKENIKTIIFETIKTGIIYVIVMVINLLAIKIFGNILNYEVRKTTILSIPDMFNTIIKMGYDMVTKTFGIGPKYWYLLLIIVITLIFLAYVFKQKKFKISILEYIVLFICCVLIPIVPMLATPIESQYMETRMAISFGSSIGIILLFVNLYLNKLSVLKYLTSIIIFIMVLVNSVYFIYASNENIVTNDLDKNIAKLVIEEISNYQMQTNIKIENIGLIFDKNPMSQYDGHRWLGVINTRSMGTEWSAIETIELYSGEKFNKVEVPENVKQTFSQKDWNNFNEEQLIFDGNNLYLCLY